MREFEIMVAGQINNLTDYSANLPNSGFVGKVVSKKSIDYIMQLINDAWVKMGYPGDCDYYEKATKEELIYFGRFRALEEICDDLNIDWTSE